MSDLDQIKANCAQYGQQRNQLEDQINRDYQCYRIEVSRIFQAICSSKSQTASKSEHKANRLIAVSGVSGAILIVIGLALMIPTDCFTILFCVLGMLIIPIGVGFGMRNKDKAVDMQVQNRHELDDLRRQINEVFPDLV